MSTQKATNGQATTPPDKLQSDILTARVLRERLWRPVNVEDDWRVFVIVGREGSGKSHTAMSILEKVDPSFGAERVHFKPENFLKNIHGMPADERQGKAIMLDEAGVGMGVRSWHDQEQIKLNKLLQTARDDNMIVALTLPRLSELDSQLRGRLHGFCEMDAVHPGDHAKWSWKDVRPTRDERDELYKTYPRMEVGGRVRRVTQLKIGPPPRDIAAPYETKKTRFKQEYYEETVEELEDGDDEEDDGASVQDIAAAIKEDGVDDVVSEHGGNGTLYINWRLIKAKHDVSRDEAKQVRDLLSTDPDVEL